METDTLLKRFLRYITLFLVLYLACTNTHTVLPLREVLIISMIGSITFGIIDMYYPVC